MARKKQTDEEAAQAQDAAPAEDQAQPATNAEEGDAPDWTNTDEDVSAAGAVSPEAPRGHRDRDGIEPHDMAKDDAEADSRGWPPEGQTTHERERGIDPRSGTAAPAVIEGEPGENREMGGVSTYNHDSSGRKPLEADADAMLTRAQEGLTKARSEDAENDALADGRKGWRTPAQLGIPAHVMARIQRQHVDHVEVQTVTGMQHMPETGVRYRVRG